MSVKLYGLIIIASMSITPGITGAAESDPEDVASERIKHIEQLEKPLYNPFIERYVLDELKQLRTEIFQHKTAVTKTLASNRLTVSDRAIQYATDTVNNMFYILTAAISILVLMGWTSLRDIKNKIESIVDNKVLSITQEYENRLETLETKLKARSEEIISNHEEISKTNEIHSLWMKAGLESAPQIKIEIYDQILKLKPDDVEALTYKADMVLELGESEWALNLCNKAISIDEENGLAFWQRACANASLNYVDAALSDIFTAVEFSPQLKNELENEPAFETLKSIETFQDLLSDESG